MKIFLKTLKGDKIEFEVQVDETVVSLKQRVKETQGHDVELQKLIAAGRIMEDAKLLSEYSIKEGDNIVIMVAKPKPQPKANQPPPQEVRREEVPPPAQPVAGQPAAAPAAALLSGPEFEASVQRVMELGFPRDQTEAALRAAFGNPDRAIDYLMGGFAAEGQMEQEGEEEDDPEEAGEAGENPFDFLMSNPAMAQIRQAIQQNPNPALIQTLVQQIAASNPDLARLIQEHPQEFMQFILQPPSSDPQIDPRLISALPRPGAQIQLAREEIEAVRNLASLGFSEEDALEAYLSCDKNEAMAASLLFESYTPLTAQRSAGGSHPPS